MAARQAAGRFTSVEDVRRRARLSARAMELLAHADAFRTLGADRRRALWETQALRGEELPLFSAASDFGPEEDPHLPVMPLAEHVAHDYTRLRLSLKAHPMAFFRKSCDRRRMARSDELATRPNGQRLELMGLVLVRQRPGSAKGVIFMTLEDEVGAANVIVWPDAFTRYRREVLGGRLLAITGRLQREGKVIHIIAERIVDWSQLLARLADGESFGEAGMARADEGRNPREDPRQAADDKAAAAAARRAAAGVLPKSRDFH
jgi:error-prone DNA polymerase